MRSLQDNEVQYREHQIIQVFIEIIFISYYTDFKITGICYYSF